MEQTHKIDNSSLRYDYSDDWLWNIKETDKRIVLTMISNWWMDYYDAPTKIIYTKPVLQLKGKRIWKYKICKHMVEDNWDWSYTLYMDRDWQPIYFEKIPC